MDFKDNIADDGAFVPRLTGDGHPDLSFERLLFSTFPTVLLIALFPFHLRYYYRQPARVFSRRLLWTKLVCQTPISSQALVSRMYPTET